MKNQDKNQEITDIIIKTAVLETLIIGIGVFAWLVTGRLFWIFSAALLAIGGFSIPAILTILKKQKGR